MKILDSFPTLNAPKSVNIVYYRNHYTAVQKFLERTDPADYMVFIKMSPKNTKIFDQLMIDVIESVKLPAYVRIDESNPDSDFYYHFKAPEKIHREWPSGASVNQYIEELAGRSSDVTIIEY